MRILLVSAALLLGTTVQADNQLAADTAHVVNIEETIVVTAPKENAPLRQMPGSVSFFSSRELNETQSTSLKELSAYVPNFFMPDYGSALTSAVYIRGIGSRINTPAVGLYVDNVAYADKSAYDISFLDVERIDVLRGPQATLYGRNTMGGLIRVFTRNPFRHPGTDVRMGFSSRDMGHTFSASHHQRVSRTTAFSLGGFYRSKRGMFKNTWRNEYADQKEAGGGRGRLIWMPSERWRLDFSTDYSYTDEGGYAYRYLGATDPAEEIHAEHIGTIFANQPSYYRRSLFNSSLNASYTGQQFELSSITAFQNLHDNMTLDQDFTCDDLFRLTQKQRGNTWSEELTAKSKGYDRHWDWVSGLYAMQQRMHTQSPVSLTETFMQSALSEANTYMGQMRMGIDMTMRQSPFVADGRFETPVTDMALFHQSTFHHLLGVEGLDISAGLRVEHERTKLEYDYGGTLDYDLTIRTMGPTELNGLSDRSYFQGKLKHHTTQLLPKATLSYRLDGENNLYASWSKGYRSGGFNVQMFGDLVQAELRSQMMGHVRPVIETTLNHPSMAQMPEHVKVMILNRLSYPTGNVAGTYYKPEYSYNYEIGGHFSLWQRKVQADMAAFYMDIHDQQISKFVTSDLGRAMINAGRGRSVGAEITLNGSALNNRLIWNAAYGYTHSTFRRYETGEKNTDGTAVDYKGNRVPFVPSHQFATGISWRQPLPVGAFAKGLLFGISCTGAGHIYWNEENTLKQPFYALLNAHAGIDFGPAQVEIWGKNLTDTHYDTFAFTSQASTRELKFAQQGRPLQFGVDLKIHF